MKYRVKFVVMGNAVADINNAAKSLVGYAERLVSVRNMLSSFDELKSLKSSIGSRVTAINKAAAMVKNSAVCLDNIRIEYITAEKKAHLKLNRKFTLTGVLTAAVGRVTVPGAGGRSFPGISWRDLIRARVGAGAAVAVNNWPKINWDKIKEWLDRIKPTEPTNTDTITLEQKKAADSRMQAEIKALYESYKDRWFCTISEKERMQILNDFLADIQRIMGTSAKPKLRFKSLLLNDKGVESGRYCTRTRRITLNKKLLLRPEGFVYLFKAAIHEARHAYQHEAAFKNKHTVSDEARAEWKHNFKNYKQPGRTEKSYDRYKNQPIERDAYIFVQQSW
jgi:hypothetical protein